MSYYAYITTLKNVRKHSNADRLMCAECLGSNVIVGLDSRENDVVCFFPDGGCISYDFLQKNNLLRSQKTGFFEDNGRVQALKLRGEKSEGFSCPLSYLAKVVDPAIVEQLKPGDRFDVLGGVKICEKYVTPETKKHMKRVNNIKKGVKQSICPLFKKHFDTEQFLHYSHTLKKNSLLVITEKLHGTSLRCGYLQRKRLPKWWEKLLTRFGVKIDLSEYVFVVGTRNTVKNLGESHQEDLWKKAAERFKDKLNKNETVYAEICGYEPSGKTIMPSPSTSLVKDKEFEKRWGSKMVYSYGCEPKEFDVYVYRMTLTNEDGVCIDYSYDDLKRRCEEMAVKYVPELARVLYDGNEDALKKLVFDCAEGPSTVDPRHIREGVCVRAESGFWTNILKYKSYYFRVLEQICKDDKSYVDIEEAN